MVSEMYNKTAEKLLEKLKHHVNELNLNCVKFPSVFPWDEFVEYNPLALKLAKEVEDEYNYGLSVYQCSWAVTELIKTYKNDWMRNLKGFTQEMFEKIFNHLDDKGLSWRNMTEDQLMAQLLSYYSQERYVDVANLAFMLYENNKLQEANK